MDTQKTVRKYLWYDLIANLCFGLVTMINSLSSIIKTDSLKTIVSTAGLINVIIFVVFTIKGRRLVSKYYDSELNKMGISMPKVGDKNFQGLKDTFGNTAKQIEQIAEEIDKICIIANWEDAVAKYKI